MSKRLQFYGPDKITGNRRIFSFKVESKADAIRGLQRMNIQAGWYVPDSNKKNSDKIENPDWIDGVKTESFFDRLDKFLQL